MGACRETKVDGVERDAEVERALLGLVPAPTQPGTVFVVGGPRTGSTLLYQMLALAARLPFVSNLANANYPHAPIVGIALQRGAPSKFALESEYGKTRGAFAPSEASAVMRQWCGGDHPSQSRSACVIPGREDHMRRTLACAELLFDGRPMVIKNPWNCFRVRSLAAALPSSRFVWIRRDPRAAAASDLAARRVTKGNETDWNSATPSNVDELRRLPPVAQVVENQFEFSLAVESALAQLPASQWTEVWYEDLVADPASRIAALCVTLGLGEWLRPDSGIISGVHGESRPGVDSAAIGAYVAAHRERLARFLRPESCGQP